MKAIMKAIKPKQLVNILNGDATILICKQFPKDYQGWVYCYCTKEKGLIYTDGHDGRGEYVDFQYYCVNKIEEKNHEQLSGKVVARFWCDKVEKFDLIEEQKYKGNNNDDILKYNECIRKQREIANRSCLTICDLVEYCDTKALGINQKGMIGYAIHISKLEIFDEPKELSEFYKEIGEYHCYRSGCPYFDTPLCRHASKCEFKTKLTKAPKNYCYIESEE